MSERIWSDDPNESINKVYEWSQTDMRIVELVQQFHSQQEAQQILTNTDFKKARKRVAQISERIRDKDVLELGAGVGFAAIEMAEVARFVTAVESDPGWSWVFCQHLYRLKPKNLTWMFDRLYPAHPNIPSGYDVAVVFTRSGVEEMRELCSLYANEVIMFHQEYPDE